MSLETDTRDALIEALRQKNNVEVGPEDFDNVKPSDPGIGAKDGSAWLTTLEIAVGYLVEGGYSVRNPSLAKATELRGQVLLESSIYLEELCGTAASDALIKAAAAAAVAGAVTYATLKRTSRKPASRKSSSRKKGRC